MCDYQAFFKTDRTNCAWRHHGHHGHLYVSLWTLYFVSKELSYLTWDFNMTCWYILMIQTSVQTLRHQSIRTFSPLNIDHYNTTKDTDGQSHNHLARGRAEDVKLKMKKKKNIFYFKCLKVVQMLLKFVVIRISDDAISFVNCKTG